MSNVYDLVMKLDDLVAMCPDPDIYKLVKALKDEVTTYFPVVMVAREDLMCDSANVAEDKALAISDTDMQYVADKLGETLMDYYWLNLADIVEYILPDAYNTGSHDETEEDEWDGVA